MDLSTCAVCIGDSATYPPVHLVLLDFALRLDHEQSVVKQEHHEVPAVSLRITKLAERAFINELATIFF